MNSSDLYPVYDYTCWTFDRTFVEIRIFFFNTKEYQYDGADHSFPSKLRHEFALDLYNSIKTTKGTGWMKLPQHEYIEKLKQNDFNYKSFQINEMTESLVSISINPLSETEQ